MTAFASGRIFTPETTSRAVTPVQVIPRMIPGPGFFFLYQSKDSEGPCAEIDLSALTFMEDGPAVDDMLSGRDAIVT